jgi:hypothetical protein
MTNLEANTGLLPRRAPVMNQLIELRNGSHLDVARGTINSALAKHQRKQWRVSSTRHLAEISDGNDRWFAVIGRVSYVARETPSHKSLQEYDLQPTEFSNHLVSRDSRGATLQVIARMRLEAN